MPEIISRISDTMEWVSNHHIAFGLLWFVFFVCFIFWVIYAGSKNRSKYLNKYSLLVRLALVLFYIFLLSLLLLSIAANEVYLPRNLLFRYMMGALLIGTLVLSIVAIYRIVFKRGTDSEMTDFDGTWMTFSNSGVEGEEAVDDGYNFIILVLVFHQLFNLFSVGYVSFADNSTSRLIREYVEEGKRPAIPDGYKWRDFTDLPAAILVDRKWKVEYQKQNRIKKIGINLEKSDSEAQSASNMTITIYPSETVWESKVFRNYAFGYIEDLIADDAQKNIVLKKLEYTNRERDFWYRKGHVRQYTAVSKNDSKILIVGLANAGDSITLVIKVSAPIERAEYVFKSVEPTLKNLYLKHEFINALF